MAFDIRSQDARNRCVRVLTRSLVDYQAGTSTISQDNFSEVFNLIFEVKTKTIPATVVWRNFHCGDTHVYNLIKDGLIRQVGERQCVRGPLASARIERQSLYEFLKRRQM